MAVTDWADCAPSPSVVCTELEGANRKTVLATCQYFTVEKYDLVAERLFTGDGGSFRIINCVAGTGRLTWAGGSESLTFGDTLLIPAQLADITLCPNGEATFVLSYVP
jgi:mannose-6-phosphate isomerase class I